MATEAAADEQPPPPPSEAATPAGADVCGTSASASASSTAEVAQPSASASGTADGGAAQAEQPRPWLTWGSPCDYPYDKSTSENYSVDEVAFVGPFAAVRSTRDYGYHVHYAPARQRVQDVIIGDALHTTARHFPDHVEKKKLVPAARDGRRPWIVFMAGGMGVGKGFVLTWAHKRQYFDLSRYVHVDQDKIKFLLPEMDEYVRRNKVTAGSLTHHESGFVAEVIQEQALLDGKNIVVDGSLRDWRWYRHVFQELRRKYSYYKIAVVKVTCERATMLQRAHVRGEATGRVVPEDLLLSSLDQVDEGVEQLTPLADWMMEVNNESVPSIVASAAVNEPRDEEGKGVLQPLEFGWDEFRAVWKRQMGENFDDAEVRKALQSVEANVDGP